MSRLMEQAEERLGCSLSEGLADIVTKRGLTGAARDLGVSVGVVQYWIKKFDIKVSYIALSPRDTIRITRKAGKSSLSSPAFY